MQMTTALAQSSDIVPPESAAGVDAPATLEDRVEGLLNELETRVARNEEILQAEPQTEAKPEPQPESSNEPGPNDAADAADTAEPIEEEPPAAAQAAADEAPDEAVDAVEAVEAGEAEVASEAGSSSTLESSIDEALLEAEARASDAGPPPESEVVDPGSDAGMAAEAAEAELPPDEPKTVAEIDEQLSASAEATLDRSETDSAGAPDSTEPSATDESGQPVGEEATGAAAPVSQAAAEDSPAEVSSSSDDLTPAEPAVNAEVVGAAALNSTAAAAKKPSAILKTLSITSHALGAPLRSMPSDFRDLIGWFALITGFNAVCLWLYLLMN